MSDLHQPAAPLLESLAATQGLLEARIRELDAEVIRLRDARLQELEEKERLADRLARLLAAMPAGVVVLDGRGWVREANPAARALLGEPLLDTAWVQVIARAFEPDLKRADLVLRDGRLVVLQTCPLGHEPGQILLLQEVTESRRQQARMEHSRRLADMGRMAATLAHQIRTPLASALLYVSQLNRPLLGEEKRLEFVAKALGRLRDLERLINEMLAFSRGEAGEGEWLNPRRCLEAAVEVFKESCAQRGIRLRVAEGCAEDRLRANPTLLATALHNLINNAIQSAAEGGEIALYAAPAQPSAMDLVVQDNGGGVPMERRDQLFEPFATSRSSGTGLGLAVVRAVARAHGGEAWYEAVPEGGSRFGMRLPAHAAVPSAVGAA